MNSYVAWGIFGIISGLIASFADVPLVMPLKKCGVRIIGALGFGFVLLSVLLIIAGA